MTLFAYIKSFFVTPEQPTAPSIYHHDAQAFRVSYTAYLAEKAAELPLKLKRLESHYGVFDTFLYRPNFECFIHTEFLPVWQPKDIHIQFFGNHEWHEKHPYNFPGPFYTGASDTVGTGVYEAPDNVANDSNSREYVFRQPRSYDEFLKVLDAAGVEMFSSYSANGNDHWTYAGCKNWWRNRHELLAALAQADVIQANNGQAQAYITYLTGDAEMDLRRYCYFLENGVYPSEQIVLLPVL